MSPENQPLLPRDDEPLRVYPTIHMIRHDVTTFIDTPLNKEALTTPDLTFTLIKPLFDKYCNLLNAGNNSVVFCLLLNRIHFIRDRNLATSAVSRTRADLCEILATRALREYGNNLYQLALALTTSFPIYSGADERALQVARDEHEEDLDGIVGNAIELAILGKAKRFIKSSSCQKIINCIWTGKIVYQATSSRSILSDTYKRNPIHFYDPHKAPLLDHYRLKVPFIRSVLEYLNFLILFFLFVVAIELNEPDRINIPEIFFMVYALGFTLEKVAAMQEHGIRVYFKGTWNGFDLAFVTTYVVYAVLRLYGAYYDNEWALRTGDDCLAVIACLLFPRLAFVTLKNNLMVLSLRAMMMQFLALMLIAAFCFCGFLYALWTLSRNEAGYSVGTIAWWMLDLWFGLDASGFDKATRFHRVFGPVLMVTYACLSNTLLLTVLVSILSNTFSKINEDAAAEAMFRRAVSTIEGVKADSLFSYQPPVNLIAVCVMLPMSMFLSPRWFHKVNVFTIRITSFPILLLVALYERQSKKYRTTGFKETLHAASEKMFDTLPRQLKRLGIFERLAGPDADIDFIFEIEEELNNSALDTADDDYVQFHSQQGPLTPQKTGSRPTDVPHPQSPASAKSSPSDPPPAPRNRLMSMLSGAPHSVSSPLQDFYQPINVENSGTSAVSFGPMSRRRLSSATQRRDHLASNTPSTQAGGLKKFPMMDDMVSESPRSVSSLTSPTPKGVLPTAGEIVEEETNSGGIGNRLTQMEERQKRIESLLEQIAQGMKIN